MWTILVILTHILSSAVTVGNLLKGNIFTWRCILILSLGYLHPSDSFLIIYSLILNSELYVNINLGVSLLACQCSAEGSRFSVCDSVSGQCVCLPNVEGRRCDSCSSGSYNFPLCQGNFVYGIQLGLSSHTQSFTVLFYFSFSFSLSLSLVLMVFSWDV